MEYYRAFVEKYPALGKWQESLQIEAVTHNCVSLYTVSNLLFPMLNAKLGCSNAPKSRIILYRVWLGVAWCRRSYFVTLDLEIKSSLLLSIQYTTQQSWTCTREEQKVAYHLRCHDRCRKVFEEVYNVKWRVPLEVDVEIGKNSIGWT